MRSDLHDITVEYQTETALAVCIRKVEGGRDIWIPKASCEFAPLGGDLLGGLSRGATITLTAPEKVLRDKGLI